MKRCISPLWPISAAKHFASFVPPADFHRPIQKLLIAETVNEKPVTSKKSPADVECVWNLYECLDFQKVMKILFQNEFQEFQP